MLTRYDNGLYISFLGIDGIGKTTLAQNLAKDLRNRGQTVAEISWRSSLDADLPIWPQEALRTMWMDTYRLLFGGSQIHGTSNPLPEQYAEWVASDVEGSLGRASLSASAPSGPLAAFLVEFAGNIVLYPEVIRPALLRGEVVIQETHPYKHVLKEYLVARRLANHDFAPYTCGDIELLFGALERFFGSTSIRPDIGLLVDGPVELAHRWRLEQAGQVGLLEDLRSTGEIGGDGFIELQKESAEHYHRVARHWGWKVHAVLDVPVEENLSRGLELLREEISSLRPDWYEHGA